MESTQFLKDELKIIHNAGFFSCCSVRLGSIVEYFNRAEELPKLVDSSEQFMWYKENDPSDVTFDYFKEYNDVDIDIKYKNKVDYHDTKQFGFYKNLDFPKINPFIEKYFSPSSSVSEKIQLLKDKYDIDIKNTCALFHRGHDKHTEQIVCTHEEKIEKAKELQAKNPDIRFLIQSDETEFIDKALAALPNSFYCKDEIFHMKHDPKGLIDFTFRENVSERAQYFLAVVMLMARCKYVITSAANVDIWISLFRGHADNVTQYYKNEWSHS